MYSMDTAPKTNGASALLYLGGIGWRIGTLAPFCAGQLSWWVVFSYGSSPVIPKGWAPFPTTAIEEYKDA